MTFERDKTKPVFEDFVIEQNGDFDLWFLVKGDPCGKLSFRLLPRVEPTAAQTYDIVFDTYHQRIPDTAGWRRLSFERPDLASWFKDITATGFPRCEDCNQRWKEAGCP